MMKGFYTAASGLINRGNVINTISNNIANSNTVGYKKDDVILKSFGEHMTYRLSNNKSAEIGQTNGGIIQDEIFTQYQQGALQDTGSPFDLAIEGEGFFTLQLSNGERALTRSGQFQMNNEGYLTDMQGNMVLSANGPIKINTSDFYISQAGEIYINDKNIGSLLINNPGNTDLLKKQEGLILAGTDEILQADKTSYAIRQGSVEISNVDMIKEMAGLIENSRAYQSCGQILKMMDSIMGKSVNEIARF